MIFWLDDFREPDESLGDVVWAKTYEEAVKALSTHRFLAAYLDHDLGWDDRSGLDVVLWMIEHDAVPPTCVIHSHNVLGAERMRDALLGWSRVRHTHVTVRLEPAADEWPEPLDESDVTSNDDPHGAEYREDRNSR